MKIIPHFLESAKGRIFCIERIPEESLSLTKMLLILPPFGEEMNKSRHMFSLLSEALTGIGVGVALLDFYGSGDSEGSSGDALIALWQEDTLIYLQYLQETYGCDIDILAVRTGALVFLGSKELVSTAHEVFFWNPILNGKQFIGQFFRTRLAADMMKKTGARLTMQDIVDELQSDGVTEVAGYTVSKGLYKELSEMVPDMTGVNGRERNLTWFEINPQPKSSLMPISEKYLGQLAEADWDIRYYLCVGDTFWSTQEISTAPDAIEEIRRLYKGDSEDPSGSVKYSPKQLFDAETNKIEGSEAKRV